jgi:uracil-DNA glycosylase
LKIAFVASNPSHLNSDPNVPFVGSKSEKIFDEWLDRLEVRDKEYIVVNVSNTVTPNNRPLRKSEWELEKLQSVVGSADRVVALGKTAGEALDELGITHFRMPHPSPLNRKLNDKRFIESRLHTCWVYLMPDTEYKDGILWI